MASCGPRVAGMQGAGPGENEEWGGGAEVIVGSCSGLAVVYGRQCSAAFRTATKDQGDCEVYVCAGCLTPVGRTGTLTWSELCDIGWLDRTFTPAGLVSL